MGTYGGGRGNQEVEEMTQIHVFDECQGSARLAAKVLLEEPALSFCHFKIGRVEMVRV